MLGFQIILILPVFSLDVQILERGDRLQIEDESEHRLFAAGPGKIWTEFVVAEDAKRVFAIRAQGNVAANSFDGLYELDLVAKGNVVRRIDIKTNFVQPAILRLYSSSASGDRILVLFHFALKTVESETYYESRPFIFETDTGIVREIDVK